MSNKVRLVLTCGGCPEQYDAFIGEERVGYLRLRHGHFRVECPDSGGDLVYEATPNGDGIFEPSERDYYLRFAVDAILKWKQNGLSAKPTAPDVEYEMVDEPWE